MSIPAKAIRKMVAMGLDAAQIADLCEIIEEGFARPVEISKAALRTRKWREKTETVTSDVTVTSQEIAGKPSPIVTVTSPVTSLACGEDNPSKLVDTCLVGVGVDAGAWDRSRIEALEKRLRETAGEALNAVSVNLLNPSPIVGLLKGGDGPACDLELDVLPAIRVVCASARPGAITRWSYFRPAILKARDERLTGAPSVVAVDFQRGQTGPPRGYRALEAEDAAMRAEVRKRLLESP